VLGEPWVYEVTCGVCVNCRECCGILCIFVPSRKLCPVEDIDGFSSGSPYCSCPMLSSVSVSCCGAGGIGKLVLGLASREGPVIGLEAISLLKLAGAPGLTSVLPRGILCFEFCVQGIRTV